MFFLFLSLGIIHEALSCLNVVFSICLVRLDRFLGLILFICAVFMIWEASCWSYAGGRVFGVIVRIFGACCTRGIARMFGIIGLGLLRRLLSIIGNTITCILVVRIFHISFCISSSKSLNTHWYPRPENSSK